FRKFRRLLFGGSFLCLPISFIGRMWIRSSNGGNYAGGRRHCHHLPPRLQTLGGTHSSPRLMALTNRCASLVGSGMRYLLPFEREGSGRVPNRPPDVLCSA